MRDPGATMQRPQLPTTTRAIALLLTLVLAAQTAEAGEGGTSHVLPGATATLADLPATAPTWFLKPMYLHYDGRVSAEIPTAAGLAGHVHATASTVALVAGRTFEQTILGGAHYTFVVALPYTWLDISARVETPFGAVARRNRISGLGDMTLVPLMLAWKLGDWQLHASVPVYAPTGSYEKGRLGNPGLHDWTFDPTIGAVFADRDLGFNAMLHAGLAINTENPATDYRSGALMHFEGALQQLLPLGPGALTFGVEGFFFDQVTGDSGSGAILGDFEGRTTGVGPLLGWIQPFGDRTWVVELKWLSELGTKRRLDGDYVWLKMVFKF